MTDIKQAEHKNEQKKSEEHDKKAAQVPVTPEVKK